MSQRKLVHLGVLAIVSASFLAPVATPVWAGQDGVGDFDPNYGPSGPSYAPPEAEGVPLAVANPEGTSFVTGLIADAYAICSNLPQKEYTVDCLGERLEVLARSLPNRGDYAEAKKVIADTSKQLRSLARKNRSRTKPRARLVNTVRGKKVTTSPVIPVRTEAVEQTIRQAAVIMKEAETKLLRSSANSDRRKVHYAQMAQAIGSNKVLLRAI